MNVYLYQSWTEKELKNDYIWSALPTSWLLWYRPLQSDLKDASGNGKDGSWLSWTWTISTAAGKTWARVTMNSSYRSTQHVVTTLTYNNTPISLCWWICYNSFSTSSSIWTWLMSNVDSWWQSWITIWTRPFDNYYPQACIPGLARITASVPSTNTWYFRWASREWNTIKTYLNWSLTNTVTDTNSLSWWVWKLWCWMIDSWQSLNNWTDWWVRHCAVYNRILSADEFMDFYNQTK